MNRESKVFIAKLVGSMLFCMTVLGIGCYFNAQPSGEYSSYAQVEKAEIVRLQPKAMAEATYHINREIERRFKP